MLNDVRDYAIKKRLQNISKVILVGSGKGGVGKSTIAVSLSLALKDVGYEVGLLDADIHGPTDAILLSVKGQISGDRDGISPYVKYGIKVMSIGAFSEGEPLVAYGKAKIGLIKDMLAYVNWGKLDYLVVDLPPGIGDEVLGITRYARGKSNGVVVTTPGISVPVVQRFINFLKGEGIPISLVIINMAYINCDGKNISLFGNEDILFEYPSVKIPLIVGGDKINEIKNMLLSFINYVR